MILIENFECSDDYTYQAQCEIYGDNYIFGNWETLKGSSSRGVMSLTISTSGDYWYGYHFGRNSQGIEQIGPWVIAKNPEALLRAKEMLKDPNYNFKSDASVEHYTKDQFHMYHLTRSENRNIWKHQILDFTKNDTSEVLITDTKISNKGTTHHYRVNAGLIGMRFIMIMRAIKGKEEPAVCLYPFMGIRPNEPINYGVMLGQDWDSGHYLSRTIISKKPLIEENDLDSDGCQVLDKGCKILDKKWEKGFFSANDKFNKVRNLVYNTKSKPRSP